MSLEHKSSASPILGRTGKNNQNRSAGTLWTGAKCMSIFEVVIFALEIVKNQRLGDAGFGIDLHSGAAVEAPGCEKSYDGF